MKKLLLLSFLAALIWISSPALAQDNQQIINEGEQHPTLITTAIFLGEVPSIASQIENGTFKPAEDIVKEFNPKKWGANTAVPGKGLPIGNDPLLDQQSRAPMQQGRAPILTFEAASATATPTDPTGAVGPNHFVNAWNSSFRIWDKAGNPLTAVASLGTVLPGTMGDPIVMYDQFADRFLITEFYSNGFDVAISKGPNPVTSGWWVYRFPTNTFPDYPKFSLWSDGYYITANKDQGSASTSQVVFALERDKMIAGNPAAQMIGFPLTGIVTSGFYSPLGFNVTGSSMPPAGNAPIVYMQDDAWSGVSADHLKVWSVNVNWTTPASSTISAPQVINTTAFDGLFDGGSFSNLPQPSGSDIDALQATIMYMAQYRRFPTYNCAVFNFVVDLNGADNLAGIRWYELRQTTDGAPWTIYQEGTYTQPNGHSAFSGNMCMDMNGNIALAYTTVSTTQYPSLRYTGRYANDPLGTMTLAEEVIANGTQSDPATRYGDYSQMTIDPSDDVTFWSIGEYFNSGRKNQVGVFNIAPPALTARFSGAPTNICTGGTVNFTDNSLGSPITWSWNFGDPASGANNVSSLQNPSHVYANPGTYTVTLTVTDAETATSTEVKTDYILVKEVIANFSGTPASVVVGNSVTFTDLSSCSPTTWTWSFPGGSPSSYVGQTPPAILYSTIGTYDVTLTVTKGASTDTKTLTGYINVLAPEFNMANGSVTTCTGNFYDSGGSAGSYANSLNLTETFYPSTPGAMVRMTFNSFSTESGYDYLRIYNGTSTSATLIGTYHGTTGPGTVTASNASGALTFNFTSDGSVTGTGWSASISCFSNLDPPVAAFTASSTSPAMNNIITLTDQSVNTPTSWAWTITPATFTFANGTTASSQSPQIQFSATGLYSVTLTVSNANGTDTEVKTDYINVLPFAYCTPTYTSGTGYGDYITLVQLGSINNATGASATPYYTYYSSLSTDLSLNTAYTITLSPGTYSSGNYIAVWIDFNKNGTFETTEKLGVISIAPTPATGTINFTVPADATPGVTRMRVREVWNNSTFDACSGYGYGEVEDYNVNIVAPERNLNLTVFLEGLFNGTAMSQAQNGSGNQFPGTVADQITVELHSTVSPFDMVAGPFTLDIHTDGNASTTLPTSLNGNYYLVIKHRNSIETWSGSGVSFSGSGAVTYNFTTAASQAFGSNLKLVGSSYVLYGGDVSQDGLVDGSDMAFVDNASTMVLSGYNPEDINGDGIVDGSDMANIDNNSTAVIQVQKP
jgi:PKD repeat protein